MQKIVKTIKKKTRQKQLKLLEASTKKCQQSKNVCKFALPKEKRWLESIGRQGISRITNEATKLLGSANKKSLVITKCFHYFCTLLDCLRLSCLSSQKRGEPAGKSFFKKQQKHVFHNLHMRKVMKMRHKDSLRILNSF